MKYTIKAKLRTFAPCIALYITALIAFLCPTQTAMVMLVKKTQTPLILLTISWLKPKC